jgi:hypothetical protein
MVDEIDGEKRGLKAAVSAEHDPDQPVPGECVAEQMEMLPLGKVKPAENACDVGHGVRGPGRPAGSKNKNTEAWRDYILGRYTSPLIALAETYSRPIALLMEELKCDPLDAFKLQMAAAKELAPYVHGKMPTEVDLGDNGLIQLTINTGANNPDIGAQAVPAAVEVMNSESEQNQLLNHDDFSKSNENKSNELAQGTETSKEKADTTD